MKIKDKELIKSVLISALKREDDATEVLLATAESPSYDFYKRLDADIKNIRASHHTSLGFKKIVAIIAAALIIFSMTGISIFAFRDRIKGFIIEHFDGFARLTTDDNEDDYGNARCISVNYIPEGFEQIKNEYGPFNVSAVFEWKHGDDNIRLYCNILLHGSINVDTENNEFEQILIGDKSVYRTQKYGKTTLTWTDDIMVYSLDCFGIEWDEIVRIFEGIKYEEAE